MKIKHIATVIAVTAGFFLAVPRLNADDKDTHKTGLEKAKNTEKNIRQAEPPKVSTGNAKSSQQICDEENAKEAKRQKERKSPKNVEPPAPGKPRPNFAPKPTGYQPLTNPLTTGKTAPAPAKTAPTPVKTAPAPAKTAPAPVKTAPTPAKTAPVVTRPAPAPTKPAPAPTKPDPVKTDPKK